MKFSLLFLLVAVIMTSACTAYKQVPYYQNVPRGNDSGERINNLVPVRLQPNDQLGIHVTSLSHEADLTFNYDAVENQVPGLQNRNPVTGYLVDQDGYINYPVLGLVKAAGYTTRELSKRLADTLQTYLSKPVVNVRLLNFQISVLGDVEHPGSFYITDEKININQALSLAGDLKTTAYRKNVLLVREEDSTRRYINIDLTSKDLFNSPYYYLKPDDVLYAQPNRARISADSGLYPKASIIVSVLAIIAYLIRFR